VDSARYDDTNPNYPHHAWDTVERRWIRKEDLQKPARPNGEAAIAPEFSEDSLALHFADLHADKLRYVAPWGKWLAWTGTHWEFENTLAVFDMARKICREAAGVCNKPSDSRAITKAKTVAAVEMLTRCDRRVAATIAQWDAGPSNLNAKEKILDLLTGATRPTVPEDYCMKIAGCNIARPAHHARFGVPSSIQSWTETKNSSITSNESVDTA
jgi:phage/plasmid-associated DNA primase